MATKSNGFARSEKGMLVVFWVKSQITILVHCNGLASGPPFVIFDVKQLNQLWIRSEVSGTRYALSNS